MSGSAAITCAAETMRSLAFLRAASCGNTSMPPAASISSDTQREAGDHRLVPFLEIDPRPARQAQAALVHRIDARGERGRERVGLLRRADQRAERADHVEDAGDVALVEGMHRDIGADQFGDDVGLQIGKGQHQVGLEREDLRHVGGDEGRDARLFLAHLRRPHRVAGHADDAARPRRGDRASPRSPRSGRRFARAGTWRQHTPSARRQADSNSTPPVAITRPPSSRTTRVAMRFTSAASWLT